MRKIYYTRKQWFVAVCLLILALMLAACGGASKPGTAGTGGSGNTQPSPTAPPKASPTRIAGNGTATGCPNNAVVTSPPRQANVIATSSQANKTITAHKGDVIELRLPFGHKWTGPTSSVGILQIQPPAGYAWKANNACVWRFVATGTGSAQLVFHSQALCKPGSICPMYIAVVPFTVTVK
ncbi:MAG TPA: hypothetical protein VHZ51_19140 [Ktedonobacteraceae bacterium]|jgi:hypothetical protein|nr:hypothetical protein [Ktedonobacteraceae bacterium]